ncbi:carboxypeptidase-like regulatory domain-containing protein [Cecembia rubra]|uniref:Carboxypeptidase-like protein n=1 Tax=Cecembia rubra TaxID=1485585 RepID=A0A2P8DTD7_9BACT|nr:carboxypeptidase-like regulatory domain-containing protein [Cecembia rubra]PSL00471.1 carboxypeptidase-like protein [Cecembia rubra]
MKRKNFLIGMMVLMVLTILDYSTAHAQYIMKGRVVDAETFQPVEFATVFINNSTFGDITDRNGVFEIPIPSGNYELVISFMGYQTFIFPFSTQEIRASYQFRILQETIDLEEAKVVDKRDKEWYKNLKIFEEKFLGNSINGKKSKILNPEVLILDSESYENRLVARGKDILEIQNPNLGYTIKFVLESFFHDFKSNLTQYVGQGYFFEENIPKRRKAKVEEQRKRAFEGSITHFVRALYHDKLEDEGYLVKKIELVPNPERPSDEEIEATKMLLADTRTWLTRDSLQQVIKMESLPKELEKISEDTLRRGDLVEEARNGFLFLTYSEPFFVIFNNEIEELNYRKSLMDQKNSIRSGNLIFFTQTNPLPVQISKLNLTGNALRLFEDGNYFHPFDLYLDGYMAWEKIGDLIPLDYKVSSSQ